MYCWNTATWRRRVLLPPDPKYTNKRLPAGLLAVSGVSGGGARVVCVCVCMGGGRGGCACKHRARGRRALRPPHASEPLLRQLCVRRAPTRPHSPEPAQGQQPIVYWAPLGKPSVRTVHLAAPAVPKGGKAEREFVAGVKLRTENKKPIVGLAVHPFGACMRARGLWVGAPLWCVCVRACVGLWAGGRLVRVAAPAAPHTLPLTSTHPPPRPPHRLPAPRRRHAASLQRRRRGAHPPARAAHARGARGRARGPARLGAPCAAGGRSGGGGRLHHWAGAARGGAQVGALAIC